MVAGIDARQGSLLEPERLHQPEITEDAPLEPLDAVWHLLNFFAPALGVGAIASALAKLFWRSQLKRVGWIRLAAIASGCAAATLVGGLVILGHDGRVATYAAMVLATALSLWWFGFRPFRG